MMELARIASGVRQRSWRLRLAARRWWPERRVEPLLDVTGHRWFVGLFRPEFATVCRWPLLHRMPRWQRSRTQSLRIIGPGSTVSTESEPEGCGFRTATANQLDDRPFIQPLTMNPSRRRSIRPRGMPTDFAELAGAARREVAPPRPTRRRPGSTDAWLAATSTAHERYRVAHERTTSHVVDEALRSTARTPLPHDREVAVLCATRRPHQLENVIANFERQIHPERQLVVITNSSAFDRDAVERRLELVERASVVHVDEEASLGECLNAGLDSVDSRYVAKFDDDDRYGPAFLFDLMIAHRFARAGVVGKHSHFALFQADGRAYLRFPGREFGYTSWVAGGTLVIDRHRTGTLRFRDRSVGEDGAFLADCQRAGHAVFAADRFNYVQHRTDDNTWQQARRHYLRNAVELATEDPIGLIER